MYLAVINTFNMLGNYRTSDVVLHFSMRWVRKSQFSWRGVGCSNINSYRAVRFQRTANPKTGRWSSFRVIFHRTIGITSDAQLDMLPTDKSGGLRSYLVNGILKWLGYHATEEAAAAIAAPYFADIVV
jgi:hypothetical protein